MIDYTLPLDELPDPLPIEPLTRPFDVTITPPGSKSITCRAYVLAALAKGESKIIRPLRAEDTDLLLDALCTLGAAARWEGDDVFVTGVNGRFPRGGEVNLHDGGTPTRFMIACACLAAEPVVVDGSQRMRERPIAEGVDMLRQLGAQIEYVEEEGRLPVRVVPSEEFKGGELTIGKTASSQFISALMLIAPSLQSGVQLCFAHSATSPTYIHLTLASLGAWDIEFQSSVTEELVGAIKIESCSYSSASLTIEPDASSAVYWIVAAAIADSRAVIPNLPFLSQQADVYAAKRLQPAVWNWTTGEQWERSLTWPIEDSKLLGGDFEASYFPDGALALAAALSTATEASTITGLHTLRVKETDRIAALANELRKVGCVVETTDDSITITPVAVANKQRSHDDGSDPPAEPGANGPIIIETYNDHRMAMAFAVLGLAAPGGLTLAIRNPACVKKSYPTFWQDFAKLYTAAKGE